MEFIKNHSTKIVIGLSAAAFLFGGIYLLSKPTSSPQITNNSSILSNNKSTKSQKDPRYERIIQNLRVLIEKDGSSDFLSKESLMGINQTVIQNFKDDYIAMVQNGREKRRVLLSDKEAFVQSFIASSNEAEKLMEQSSREVLSDLGVSMEMYEKSSENIIRREPNFAYMNLYMVESIKTHIPSKRKSLISKEEVIDILEFQVEQYKEVNFSNFGLGPQQTFMVKQSYISDLASVKFSYEEEDLMRNPAVLQDPDVVGVQRKLQLVLQQEQMKMGGMF